MILPTEKKGLCKRLLSDLVRFFKEDGVTDLTIQYVEGNHEAEHTWKKLGFQNVLRTANANLIDVEELCNSST